MGALENSDILIVCAPPINTKMPPLGAAYISAFLKDKGINTAIYDLNLELYNNAQDKTCWQIDTLNYFTRFEIAQKLLLDFYADIEYFTQAVLATTTKIIGFSVNIISIFVANEIAQRIKTEDPRRVIIFGGPGCFWKFQRNAIKPGSIDIFIMGEGEEALFKITQRLKEGMKINMSPMVFAPITKTNLDDLPFPTFSEFNLSAYNFDSSYKPLPLLTSRGCVRRCNYCIDTHYWPGYRFRSPEHILGEIRYHINNNKVKAFEFNDLVCNGNLRQLCLLCDLIIQEGLKIDWVSYAIIRPDMDEEFLSKLKKSGCHTLIYGLESGSDNILARMNKQYSAKEAERAIRLTHQAGICTNINLIAGFPGENEVDLLETIRFLERNQDYISEVTNISSFVLSRFSEVALNKTRYGIIWDENNDPCTFIDGLGQDFALRNKRTNRLIKILEEMGFKRSIVNKPKIN